MEPLTAALCSANPNKLRELRAALPAWQIELLLCDELPPEEGESYYENARAKARYGHLTGVLGVWTFGEDSGLEVDALGGGPGIRSSRFAGPGEDHVRKLLAELAGAGERARGARYVCELVCLSPSLDEFRGHGTLEGRIAEEPRGSGGFGYDPVFVPLGETRTVAELGDEWKHAHSHRAKAAQALAAAVAAARV